MINLNQLVKELLYADNTLDMDAEKEKIKRAKNKSFHEIAKIKREIEQIKQEQQITQ
jgi:hypothetical protein